MRIRRANFDDLSAILRLEALCFSHESERFHGRQIRSLLKNPRALALAMPSDGPAGLCGWGLGLIRRSASNRMAGRLYALAIDPAKRGRGLGRQLTQAILQAMVDAGAETLYLEVRSDNIQAISLYRSLGFAPRAKLDDYYAPGLHATGMKKRIDRIRRQRESR